MVMLCIELDGITLHIISKSSLSTCFSLLDLPVMSYFIKRQRDWIPYRIFPSLDQIQQILSSLSWSVFFMDSASACLAAAISFVRAVQFWVLMVASLFISFSRVWHRSFILFSCMRISLVMTSCSSCNFILQVISSRTKRLRVCSAFSQYWSTHPPMISLTFYSLSFHTLSIALEDLLELSWHLSSLFSIRKIRFQDWTSYFWMDSLNFLNWSFTSSSSIDFLLFCCMPCSLVVRFCILELNSNDIEHILQQLMKKRRESENNIMEVAIEKASQLISLLQKENAELKRKVDTLESQLERAININEQLKNFNKELEEEFNLLESTCDELKTQLEKSRQALERNEEGLRKKTAINKELHEKISILNVKLKEKNKSTGDEKTKMLSLENENEYLLKKLKEFEGKENAGVHKINLKYVDYENQIKEVIRLKEAFSRRCEELKADNLILTEKAAEYKQRLIEAESGILKPRRYQQLHRKSQQIKIEPNLDGMSGHYLQMVDRLLKDKLGVTPQGSFQGKMDQIGSFLSYRLTHIQKMCQTIMDKLQVKQWCKLENLKDLNTSSFRMHSYLSQLLGKAY